ncbi:helix-turn-helix domain-containing protein [Aeromonas veronii]
MSQKEQAVVQSSASAFERGQHNASHKPPIVSGQQAEVLSILRRSPTLSLNLTADYAIPEAAARIHELRERGFNIETVLQDSVIFRGRERHGVALYVLKHPEWPRPGFTLAVLPPTA